MFEIIIDKEVRKALKKLPKHDQARLIEKIEGLKNDPRPNGVKALQGNWQGFYRVRVGDYRVIYNIEDEILTIYVVKVAHRRQIYET